MSELLHYVELSDPFGVPMTVIDRFVRLEYVLQTNGVGVLTLDLDPSFDRDLLRMDGRLGVWRRPSDGPLALEGEATWLIRRRYQAVAADGTRTLRVTAWHANHLLGRRIVAYPAGSVQARKTGPVDDAMKALARENLGALATDTDRDWSAYLSVAADASLGPSVTKGFCRRNVLDALQELAAESAELGTPICFDIVTPTPGTLEFRTYAGQRGQDHTLTTGADPLIVSANRGNLAEPALTVDYSEETTIVYAAGRGQGAQREVLELEDAARITRTPLNRCEVLVDARNVTSSDELAAEGRAALYTGRPRRTFAGKLVDAPGCRYGVHWHWGDRVTAQFYGSVDCKVAAVQVVVANGAETITARLLAEADI